MLSMNLSVIVSDSLVKYRCFSNGLQRYALFLYLQTFSDFFHKIFHKKHFIVLELLYFNEETRAISLFYLFQENRQTPPFVKQKFNICPKAALRTPHHTEIHHIPYTQPEADS